MEILEKFRKYREYYNPSINNNHKNWLITLKYLQQDLQGLARHARTEVCFQHATNYGTCGASITSGLIKRYDNVWEIP